MHHNIMLTPMWLPLVTLVVIVFIWCGIVTFLIQLESKVYVCVCVCMCVTVLLLFNNVNTTVTHPLLALRLPSLSACNEKCQQD